MMAPRKDYEILLKQPHIGNKVEVLISLLYQFLVFPGARVVDGGANSGAHAIPMALRVKPGGRVYAYEPQPDVLQQLNEWVAIESLQDVVDSRGKALGRARDEVLFFVNPDNNALSSLDKAFAREGSKQITVEMEPLDYDLRGEILAFIKLDLEGGEFAALCGARSLLENSRPVVVFEFARQFSAERFGFTRDEFFAFFEGLNYGLWDAFGQSMSPETWDASSTAWEWIAAPLDDPRHHLILHIAKSFWSVAADRPPLEDWGATLEILREPLAYHNPFGDVAATIEDQ